jgi:hypothetical protein
LKTDVCGGINLCSDTPTAETPIWQHSTHGAVNKFQQGKMLGYLLSLISFRMGMSGGRVFPWWIVPATSIKQAVSVESSN